MNNSEINRLGAQLRIGLVTPDNLMALDEFRRSFRPAIQEIAERLMWLADGAIVQRPSKSTPSIIAKLLRQPTLKLTQIQDVAGLRILVESSFGQRNLVNAIKLKFPNAKLIDRIQQPSFGYRAVHFVVHSQGKPVEIQIRTILQHSWAHLSERIADAYGHEIKYGGGDAPFQNLLLSLSAQIFELEQAEIKLYADESQLSSEHDPLVGIEAQRDALLLQMDAIQPAMPVQS